MDVPSPARDALAQPTRARLFALLGSLHRPASTEELATRIGLHPNGVRVHLERLAQEGMPLAGLVLNRVHRSSAARLSAARSTAAAETLQAAEGEDGSSHQLTVAALRLHAERMQQSAAEHRMAENFTTAHPHVPVAEVPAQPDDVHDLVGLAAVGDSFYTE